MTFDIVGYNKICIFLSELVDFIILYFYRDCKVTVTLSLIGLYCNDVIIRRPELEIWEYPPPPPSYDVIEKRSSSLVGLNELKYYW